MSTIEIGGSIVVGPSGGVSAFPTESRVIQLERGKESIANGGSGNRVIDSAGTYVSLAAIGADGDVDEADTFYLRTNAAFLVRLTIEDGVGGSDLVELPIKGMLLYETDGVRRITLAEVKGQGTIEYFASKATT